MAASAHARAIPRRVIRRTPRRRATRVPRAAPAAPTHTQLRGTHTLAHPSPAHWVAPHSRTWSSRSTPPARKAPAGGSTASHSSEAMAPGSARATRGEATSVAGMPTTDTRSKCHATTGRVPTVAAMPAATEDVTPVPRRRMGVRSSHALHGRDQATSAPAPAKESWKPGPETRRGSRSVSSSRAVPSAPQRAGGLPRARERATTERITAARNAASGRPRSAT
jgi:hypothetical protein